MEHIFQLGRWTIAYKTQPVHNGMPGIDRDQPGENQGKNVKDGDADIS